MTARALSACKKPLDAALKLPGARGSSANAGDDPCAATGGTKGAFFHHFDSQDALATVATPHRAGATGASHAARIAGHAGRLEAGFAAAHGWTWHHGQRAGLFRVTLPGATHRSWRPEWAAHDHTQRKHHPRLLPQAPQREGSSA